MFPPLEERHLVVSIFPILLCLANYFGVTIIFVFLQYCLGQGDISPHPCGSDLVQHHDGGVKSLKVVLVNCLFLFVLVEELVLVLIETRAACLFPFQRYEISLIKVRRIITLIPLLDFSYFSFASTLVIII